MRAREFTIGLTLLAALSAPAGNVRLAATPALTPDGSTLVFEWQEDLWTVPVAGGQARALTRHPALDRFPVVSPDGKSVAFMSNRDSTYQTGSSRWNRARRGRSRGTPRDRGRRIGFPTAAA